MNEQQIRRELDRLAPALAEQNDGRRADAIDEALITYAAELAAGLIDEAETAQPWQRMESGAEVTIRLSCLSQYQAAAIAAILSQAAAGADYDKRSIDMVRANEAAHLIAEELRAETPSADDLLTDAGADPDWI